MIPAKYRINLTTNDLRQLEENLDNQHYKIG
jgi:hypothetical protein